MPAADQPVHKLDGGTPRTSPADEQLPPGAWPGLEVSPVQLLEHVNIQGLVGNDPLEPGVLLLQLLRPLGVIGLHAAVLVSPPVVGVFGDFQALTHLDNSGSLNEPPVGLAQLAHNLLRRVVPALHLVLLAHKGNRELTKRLNQPVGFKSIPQRDTTR